MTLPGKWRWYERAMNQLRKDFLMSTTKFSLTNEERERMKGLGWSASSTRNDNFCQYRKQLAPGVYAYSGAECSHWVDDLASVKEAIKRETETTRRNRAAVYDAIDSERSYQDMRKKRDQGAQTHSFEEFLLYMKDYLDEAIKTASRTWGPTAKPKVMEVVRKVTALGVACMEQHGAPQREGFSQYTNTNNFSGMTVGATHGITGYRDRETVDTSPLASAPKSASTSAAGAVQRACTILNDGLNADPFTPEDILAELYGHLQNHMGSCGHERVKTLSAKHNRCLFCGCALYRAL